MQFNRTNVWTQQTGKGSVAAAAARHCSFIRRSCYERGKRDWKKNSWSWWVFHFVECRDIYPARCRRSNVNGPSLLVNEAAATALWTWAATLWFTFISFGLHRILPDIYGMFAWSVGCRYRFTEDLSDCEGGPPFVCLGSNSDVQVIVGELQMVPMSSRRLGAFLLCLLLPILRCTFHLLGKRN